MGLLVRLSSVCESKLMVKVGHSRSLTSKVYETTRGIDV